MAASFWTGSQSNLCNSSPTRPFSHVFKRGERPCEVFDVHRVAPEIAKSCSQPSHFCMACGGENGPGWCCCIEPQRIPTAIRHQPIRGKGFCSTLNPLHVELSKADDKRLQDRGAASAGACSERQSANKAASKTCQAPRQLSTFVFVAMHSAEHPKIDIKALRLAAG